MPLHPQVPQYPPQSRQLGLDGSKFCITVHLVVVKVKLLLEVITRF